MRISAERGIARILKAEGVRWVSTFPVSCVNNALGREEIPIVMMRDERYAVAVADSNTAQAVRILLANLEKHSGHLDSLAALAAYYQQLGETDKAMQYNEKLEAVLRHQ